MEAKPTDHLPPVRGSNHNPTANRLKEIDRLLSETEEIFKRLENGRKDQRRGTKDET